MDFKIDAPNREFSQKLIDKINGLTKPKGSLGRLEEIALRVGLIQQSLEPKLENPHNILFAADHGIEREGVSTSPREVTWQQIFNFLKGGAGINFLCRQHGFTLRVVDGGVDYIFPKELEIVDRKIAMGTKNYLYEPAMSAEQLFKALEIGAEQVREVNSNGCNVVSFGEMGIANTSASSMYMHYFTGISLSDCVGAGAGLDNKGIAHKLDVLERAKVCYEEKFKGFLLAEMSGCSAESACAELASVDSARAEVSANSISLLEKYGIVGEQVNEQTNAQTNEHANEVLNALEVIAYFGGIEMVMAIGGMIQAAQLNMVILVDGFIMTNCILAASKLSPNVLEYAIFGHLGDEVGHKRVLDAMGVKPLLNLGLRLGEGSGAICAYPIVDSAVRMINEMETFSSAAITKYF